MDILAKSDGTTLEQHTQDVRYEAAQLVASRLMSNGRSFVVEKYLQRTGRELATLLDEVAIWHDDGKKHTQWQTACRKDFAEFETWRDANGRQRGTRIFDYSQFSKAVKGSGRHIRQANIRHEIASLTYMEDKGVQAPLPVWVAIAAHHRKLGNYHKKRWQNQARHAELWTKFAKAGSSFSHADRESFDRVLTKRYEYDGPRAWLQLADGRASAKESGDALPELKPFEYEFPFRNEEGKPLYRGVQNLIEELQDDPFAILRAPTGAGKTDAALLWAQHQLEDGRADRLVIAMPTRFTSNALSVNIAKNLSQRGLYHSSARFYEEERRKKNQTGDDGNFDSNLFTKEMLLARLLETPVTVTTIDHLCIALTGAREDHHGIFWGLAHSCVVIDEADFYDDFTQRNMIVLLHALRLLDVRVLVMSATVPESARELYNLSGFKATKIYEDASDIERKRCRIHRAGRVQKPEDIAQLLETAFDGKPLIIYANTVERAQAYRQWFEDKKFDKEKIVLYHSRFCEPDKVAIEEKLLRLMGREAWEGKCACGVAILTQIGELSVNISADVMISDLCPIDRLTQRAGRLSRFHKPKENFIGELHVVLPIKSGEEPDDEWYPAPYGSFAGGRWKLTDVLRQSNEWLVEGGYSPRDFSDLVNRLYPTANAPTVAARNNARALENSFVNNWLIVQNAESDLDDEGTHIWKSRDIDYQQTVYVGFENSTFIDNDTPAISFRNRTKFREWSLKHGVQIYGYQLTKARENGAVEESTIIIGGETDEEETRNKKQDSEKCWLVNANYYDIHYGLRLNRETFEEDYG